MKGGDDLEECPRQDKLSLFLHISKSFTLPAMPHWLGTSSRQNARKSGSRASSGEEEPLCKSDQWEMERNIVASQMEGIKSCPGKCWENSIGAN